MCERAIQLQAYIDEWLVKEIALRGPRSGNGENADVDSNDFKQLRLSATEWSHLRVVAKMLRRFKHATNQLSETSKPQIRFIWMMYNSLFDFLDQMTEELDDHHDQDQEWPEVVREAAEKGREKLRKYYSKTDEERGYLFNCATILDPTQKLTAYEEVSSQIFITL